MDYEIEFHPVGDATRAGDAISVRYGINGAHEVMVIDGGTQDSGAALVEHITKFYGAGVSIAHVVCTHPDTDHASGLRKILENFPVENLWLHGLWHHTAEMLPYFEPGWTEADLAKEMSEQYPITAELIELAASKGTQIYEPFQGVQIGPFTVLSPTEHAYVRLVPQFRKTPDANQEALEAENFWLAAQKNSFLGALLEKAAAVASSWIEERWDIELLREGSRTAAENETSTVLLGRFGDKSVLLTGDAGVIALTWASHYAASFGFDLKDVNLVQVPHHGSRSNVTPSVLDLIVGPKLPPGSAKTKSGVVSCPKDDEKHPRKMVVNAFQRRGVTVGKTQGTYYRYFSPAFPTRANEVAAQPFEWFDKVEDYD